ncbi:MAG: prolipoprotein diacylglyceryl transferase [Deltaproteobacteria bacterium]|jgi:hypothetical protein|nr:prolipoprotein diacylglyceryl transferase [Deltaproteobacteria bacterium]
MTNLLFILVFGCLCGIYLIWGVLVLPQERWQILATLPKHRTEGGAWDGINLTWYGCLSANAYLVALAVFLILTGTLQLPLSTMGTFIVALLAVCIPASRLVARVVEKKAHTLTVGGAVFVGLIVAPWLLGALNLLAKQTHAEVLPVYPVLAALGISYAFGEGLGRLACLSFGCCYGKPIDECSALIQKLFAPLTIQYFGTTKKASYASNLEGVRVLPVQALTAALYVLSGLFGIALFLSGFFIPAFVLMVIVTQGWRVLSELLRADYRGSGMLTAYQWMSALAIPYALLLPSLFSVQPVDAPNLWQGLTFLWHPGLLLTLQIFWLFIFLLTGCSAVTGATLSFHVHHERI